MADIFVVDAQSNYFSGYLVTNSGDTLRGYVQGKERSSSPVFVKFKVAKDAKAQQYSIDSCSAFGIYDKEAFERCMVSLSLSSEDKDNLSVGANTKVQTEQVYLKVLQKGRNVALYSYTDDVKTRFYILETGGKLPEELQRLFYANPAVPRQIV